MNEWEFTDLVTTWVNALIQADNNSPFRDARAEQQAHGSAERRDFTLLDKNGQPILTGEFKLPDKADGATPFNTGVGVFFAHSRLMTISPLCPNKTKGRKNY